MWSLAEQQRFQGVADTLDLLRDESLRLRDLRQPQAVSWRRLDNEIERLAAGIIQGAAANAGFEQRIAALSEQAEILADTVREIAPEEHDRAKRTCSSGRTRSALAFRVIGAIWVSRWPAPCRCGYWRWKIPHGRWR